MRLRKRWAILGLAALLPVLPALAHSGMAAEDARPQMIIGLDMQPATNGPDALGRLQPCTEAAVGATFSADIFIAGVPSLSAWELRLDYDPDVLSVEVADYNQMLISTQPSGSVFPSLFEAEKAGRHFMAATEINGTPDSGAGVLAHLTLRAVGPGTSTLTVADGTTYGPRVTGAHSAPMGDDGGDGIWDGQLTDGVVYVGGDCPAATPIPTPPPPAPSPAPGTGNTGADGGGSGSGSGSTTGGVSVAVVDGEDPGDGDGENTGSGSDSEADQGGTDGTDGKSETGGDGDEPGTSSPRSNSANDDGPGDIPFVIGGLALAAAALGAGTLFIFRRRGAW